MADAFSDAEGDSEGAAGVRPRLDIVSLTGIKRQKQVASRLWYLQPKVVLSGVAPFVPNPPAGSMTTMDLVRACLAKEAEFPAPKDAPALILAPELALHPDDISEFRKEVRSHRTNTLLILGVGQMTETKARSIEDADLWAGPSGGRFTNCALVACGGTDQLFLQPKIVPSTFERDVHWPGSHIRLFEAAGVAFAVLICSELLDRPLHETTLKSFLEATDAANRRLSFIAWIQHNPKPRSDQFEPSLQQLRDYARDTTLLIADSRPDRPNRFENYGVSGAVVPQECLADQFRFLAGRHHYVEPIGTNTHLSRVVLLRYDADVISVETVFCDAIDIHSKTAKTLFETIRHYSCDQEGLHDSHANSHIEDLIAPSAAKSKLTEGIDKAHVDDIAAKLVNLGTGEFLSFLDIALWPAPSTVGDSHVAGEKHRGGDYLCRCWRHRICIDRLSVDANQQDWLADVLAAVATLEKHGLRPRPTFASRPLANLLIDVDHQSTQIAVINPCGHDGSLGEELFNRGDRPPLRSPRFIILGENARSLRPRVGFIDAAFVPPTRGNDAARAESGVPALIYQREFWDAHTNLRMRELIEERFVA